MAHSFPIDKDPEAQPEPDPVLRPYSELEDHGSLYIAGLAVHSEWRGHGIGRQLMEATNVRARQLGRPRHSLICLECNERALLFYRRLGFTELDRRKVVPHPALHYADGDALLLVRPVWEGGNSV